MRLYDRPRPHAVRHVGDRVKLHRRLVHAGGRDYTVISPRAGTDVRFSTNHYHDTWHILSDLRGARFLGRLLWGLAYARVPGTVVLVDRPFLDPNPFDGAPPDPILLVPDKLTPFGEREAVQLRRALPHARPVGTVRWQTHGLDAAVAEARREADLPAGAWIPRYDRTGPGRTTKRGAFVVFNAWPEQLRALAVPVYRLADHVYADMAYTEMDWPRGEGEVQIFRSYRRRVSAATVARREILGSVDRTALDDWPAGIEPLIWTRGAQARQRNRFRPLPPPPIP